MRIEKEAPHAHIQSLCCLVTTETLLTQVKIKCLMALHDIHNRTCGGKANRINTEGWLYQFLMK